MYLIVAITLSLLALTILAVPLQKKYFLFPYLFFFIGPILTYFGVIGVLTGFNGSGLAAGYTFGITFYTVYIAYQISKNKKLLKKNPLSFIFSVINPLYLFSGPIPINSLINTRSFRPKRALKIFYVVNSDLILGLFFAAILAPSLTPYFYLKNSTNIIDIFLFGLLFEFFVYFNFAGYSMIAWALMRLIGIKAPRNFRQPFGANSIVDYWQRWHISFSIVLKELFFTKTKPLLGVYGAVFTVFISSALWHGATFNFVLWGLFHSILWCLGHYLNKVNFIILNYILLVFGIVVGRVIFSEIDWATLSSKLSVIIDFTKWNGDSEYIFLSVRLRDRINLFFVVFVIGWEVISPRFGFSHRDYQHLKSPYVSTLIAVYVCLAFVGFNGEPVYGNR
jgi:alginate O-acetyltransferase complex protein AlgI